VRGAYDLERGDLESEYLFVFFSTENSGGLSYSYLSCRISFWRKERKKSSVIAKEMRRREVPGVDVSWRNSARLNNKTPAKTFITKQTRKYNKLTTDFIVNV